LSAPDYPCDPGWYCPTGSLTTRPKTKECPAGKYCPVGTGTPIDCPIGTFNPFPLQDELTDCMDCTPGFYCDSLGQTQPTGPCDAGYYCDGADTSATAIDAG